MIEFSNFGIREWMLIAGGLLFLAVVIDGVRRAIVQRRHEVKLSKSAKSGFDEGVAMDTSDAEDAARVRFELPSAPRVVMRDDQDQTDVESAEATVTAAADDQPDLKTVPVLDKPVEPQLNFDELIKMSEAEPAPVTEDTEVDSSEADSTSDLQEVIDPEPFDTAAPVEEVITIHVKSNRPDGFAGSQLLELLLDMQLRFGEMDIFHKRSDSETGRQVIYSVANAVEPGTFDLPKIKQFTTPCIVFFLRLPGPQRPMDAFREMLDDAHRIAKNFDGQLLDDQRNVLHQQTLVHISERLQEFERKQLLAQKARQ